MVISSSSLFFSDTAHLMYVDRILAPYHHSLSSTVFDVVKAVDAPFSVSSAPVPLGPCRLSRSQRTCSDSFRWTTRHSHHNIRDLFRPVSDELTAKVPEGLAADTVIDSATPHSTGYMSFILAVEPPAFPFASGCAGLVGSIGAVAVVVVDRGYRYTQ